MVYLLHRSWQMRSLRHEELSNQWPHRKRCSWGPGQRRGACDELPGELTEPVLSHVAVFKLETTAIRWKSGSTHLDSLMFSMGNCQASEKMGGSQGKEWGELRAAETEKP